MTKRSTFIIVTTAFLLGVAAVAQQRAATPPRAGIDWPARGVRAEIVASDVLDQYVVFSPAADADFFCFEPVSHPVDAFNLPGGAAKYGMSIVEPGEAVAASMEIRPSSIDG